jgi:hypothetical protein
MKFGVRYFIGSLGCLTAGWDATQMVATQTTVSGIAAYGAAAMFWLVSCVFLMASAIAGE